MNEEPKSIWTRPWKGRRLFLIWLALTIAIIVTLSIGDWMGGEPVTKPTFVLALSVFGVISGSVLLSLWLFVRWLFCWRNLKRFLFDLACFATLIVLFYAEEDLRGWHAWQQFKHKWEAKGERFDRASVVPPPVPDDQNFALTPIVASSYSHILDKNGHQIRPPLANVVNRLKMDVFKNYYFSPTNGVGNFLTSTVSDLKAWQHYYSTLAATTNMFPVPAQPQSPGADVLLALSKYDSNIEELRQASKLPYSRFPLEYDKENTADILLPHLASLKGCARVLQLRAIAEMQNGQSDKALDDVKLSLRLADSIRSEPLLISHLVHIAIVNVALQPIYEGLAEHKWSDTQLVELDRGLATLDFLADYKLAMRGEMVFFQGGIFDYLRHYPEHLPDLSSERDSSQSALARFVFHLIPSGWFYQNQLRCARPMVELFLPVADVNRGIISPAATHSADTAVEADIRHRSPYNIIEGMLLPALPTAAKRFAYVQSCVDLARVGIALERYRLAHGEYPESLDALAPQFIAKVPHDIINGQPLHYRREVNAPSPSGYGDAGGQFVLYSVGWNEKDDGGEVAFTKGWVDIYAGDWVWKYPAPQ